MLNNFKFSFSLNLRLTLIMLFLSFILISILMFLYSESERKLFKELEKQTTELTKAIQIGVEEVTTGKGKSDEARLAQYLKKLNTKGVKEISIISNADEIVASTNPQRVGESMTRKRKELIIKAELGEPVSEEGKTFNVILPVVAGDTQYGYIHLRINKDDFSDVLRSNAISRVLATLFVFGIGIVFTLILSRQYTRPIEKVVNAAMRVAAGDLNQHIKVESKDEIGKLAESFNFMVTKLRTARSLEEKLREAEHLSGLGQLSRHMAHEIRNPLNFISLSIDHIATKYRPDEKGMDEKFSSLISGIKQEITRLDKLVNDFLDYSRPLSLNRQMVNIKELLDDIIDLIWAKADVEGIKIIKDYDTPVELYLDPDLFKTCVLNVVTNAFHAMASPEGEKTLTIRTAVDKDIFVLTIADKGEGVLEENLSKIFEPFFSTKETGLGLGLPLTRRVIEEHGGRVDFRSEPGKGSEMTFSLPLKKYAVL
ncbi:MAG TPA: HAMP domain-containing histidine kinase [Dissulfurispiraceae bacterium]|nr:HAMP domain-containing histidine kinase [Dissulfurispiraceae bacterium]